MNLNRRGFLSLFSAAAATAVVDPERLLWVPGRKSISIPKPRVWKVGDTIQIKRPMRFDSLYGPPIRTILFSYEEMMKDIQNDTSGENCL